MPPHRKVPSPGLNKAKGIRFADLVEVNPPVSCSDLASDSPVSFIPMSDVSDFGQWVTRQTRSYQDVKTGYSAFQEGDILFAKITPCTENGKGCHATGLVSGRGFGSTEFHVLRAKPGVDPRIVYHISVARDIRHRAASIMGGSAGQQRVPADFFQMFHLSSSILDNQTRTAHLLDALDDAIAQTRAVIDQTRRVKLALLYDLLSRGLPGRHRKYKPFKWLGGIPADWDIVQFRDISEVVRGSSPRPAGNPRYFNGDFIPWVTVLEVTRDDWVYLTATTTQLTEEGAGQSRQLKSGTLILTNSGATLGVPKIIRINCCANDGIAVFLNLNKSADKLFLYYYLASMTSVFRDVIAPGLGQPNLNTDLIGEMVVPLPPIDEQRAIAAILFEADSRTQAEECHAQQIRQMKAALSQALLTGIIRVPEKGDSQCRRK